MFIVIICETKCHVMDDSTGEWYASGTFEECQDIANRHNCSDDEE